MASAVHIRALATSKSEKPRSDRGSNLHATRALKLDSFIEMKLEDGGHGSALGPRLWRLGVVYELPVEVKQVLDASQGGNRSIDVGKRKIFELSVYAAVEIFDQHL
jgi:hypothetical protein